MSLRSRSRTRSRPPDRGAPPTRAACDRRRARCPLRPRRAAGIIPASAAQNRLRRLRLRSARRTISSRPTPSRPATIFCLAISLPSPAGRASAAIGSSRSALTWSSGPSLSRRAGGKHSCSASPGAPPMMTGITRSARPIALKRRTSSLTYWLLAASGEHTRSGNGRLRARPRSAGSTNGRRKNPRGRGRSAAASSEPGRRVSLAHQVLVDQVAFERRMQPLGPGRVPVAVAQERAISERGGLSHARLLRPATSADVSPLRSIVVSSAELLCRKRWRRTA